MRAHPAKSTSWFVRFSRQASRAAGHPAAFGTAIGVVLLWAAAGPLLGYSNTWQLAINTGTTIITFLMVFLIQNSQNRDSEAIQIKLDELIRSIDGAHLALLDLEEMDVKDLDRICRDYRALAQQARRDLGQGKSDTDVREVGSTHRDALSRKARGHRRRRD